jgi:hypothetical protein
MDFDGTSSIKEYVNRKKTRHGILLSLDTRNSHICIRVSARSQRAPRENNAPPGIVMGWRRVCAHSRGGAPCRSSPV